MSGEALLRGYVYLLLAAIVAWVATVGWLIARAGWRRLRRQGRSPLSA